MIGNIILIIFRIIAITLLGLIGFLSIVYDMSKEALRFNMKWYGIGKKNDSLESEGHFI
jgi:hypothetical protein